MSDSKGISERTDERAVIVLLDKLEDAIIQGEDAGFLIVDILEIFRRKLYE